MNILLADDQVRVRNALRILLEQQPEWRVVAEVQDANGLVEEVNRRQPDLVLLDGELPGIQEGKTLITVRAACPDVCIVALVEPQPLHKQPFPLQVDGYATKVNSPEYLLGVIRKCLTK